MINFTLHKLYLNKKPLIFLYKFTSKLKNVYKGHNVGVGESKEHLSSGRAHLSFHRRPHYSITFIVKAFWKQFFPPKGWLRIFLFKEKKYFSSNYWNWGCHKKQYMNGMEKKEITDHISNFISFKWFNKTLKGDAGKQDLFTAQVLPRKQEMLREMQCRWGEDKAVNTNRDLKAMGVYYFHAPRSQMDIL
jgi:hypothetical protein